MRIQTGRNSMHCTAGKDFKMTTPVQQVILYTIDSLSSIWHYTLYPVTQLMSKLKFISAGNFCFPPLGLVTALSVFLSNITRSAVVNW